MVMARGRRRGSRGVPHARTRLRLKVLAAMVVFMFGALTTRLWFLQVLAAPVFAREAQQNQVRLVPLMPNRGEILDRHGTVLVGERSSLVVTIDRQTLGGRADAVVFRLSQLLHIPARTLVRRMNNVQYFPYQPVPVAEDVTREDVFFIKEHPEQFPGVDYVQQAVRSYPQGDIAAQVLGHIGPITAEEVKADPALGTLPPTTQVGQAGVEQQYDVYLRGVPGKRVIQVNAQGQVLDSSFGHLSAKPGDNLVLSIDANIQKLAEQSLAEGIAVAHRTYDSASGKYLQATGGAAIVMDPRTGRILALASNPTYNPSIWIGGLSQRHYDQIKGTNSVPGALFNRAIQGAYPPGSTFKTFIGAAALKQRFIGEHSALPCPGEYQVPGDTSHTIFHNWNPANTGYLTLTSALIQSCDTFFYQLGYKFWQAYVHSGYKPDTGKGGTEFLQRDLSRMGFGKVTGIDLPLEAKGILPTNEYKKALEHQAPAVYGRLPWQPGDYVNMAIGQGFMTVTPMELAVAYSAIANGGKVYEPRVGWKIEAPDGNVMRVIRPKVQGRLPISRQEISYIRSALGGVTRPGGTAAPAFVGFPLSSIAVAGKTGTADIVGKQPYSWFAAMAPAGNPKYVVVVMVEQGGHGGTTAAPVARRILQGLFGLNTGSVVAGADQST
jgi:penicillin-binding protein 2